MKRDLFRKYVWLVEVIRHADRLTYEEISDLWLKSPLNVDGSPLALRTFHNHREAIEFTFGIKINCDRSNGNKYYLQDCETGEVSRLKIWMLQTLGLSHVALRDNDVPDRILLDAVPYEKYGLISIIEAMQSNHKVTVECDLDPERKPRTISPYAVKLWKNDWYLLAADEQGELQSYNLRYNSSVAISDEKFTYPYNFDARQYFDDSFGPFADPDSKPIDITMSIKGFERDRARLEPLHPTQREIETDGATSVFKYHFAPNEELISKVLALGTDAEVLAPASLRRKVAKRIAAIAEAYAAEPRVVIEEED